MLSLYIHIPFCDRKCGYCSFHVMALEDLQEPSKVMQEYLDALHKEIDMWGKKFQGDGIRTIYFGGGTPSSIGAENIAKIIDHIGQYFDLEYIEELSIEVNPYPESVLDFIDSVATKYKKRPRVRFSIGMQSFDNEVLKLSNRQYNYTGAIDFLRQLAPIKRDNVSYNLDFIAFGKFNTTRKGNRVLWSEKQQEFFAKIAESGFIDGYSLYTLELFEGSEWYHKLSTLYSHKNEGLGLKKFGSDDDVYEEFAILKEIILDAGYERYELSNFSKIGQNSIHNRVYWGIEDYIGLGTSASSFIRKPANIVKAKDALELTETPLALRWTNTKKLADYLRGQYCNSGSILSLDDHELTIETIFLALRTQEGIKNLSTYTNELEQDWLKKISSYEEQGFVTYIEDNLRLTDMGMDVYNEIITELLRFEK